MADELLKFEKAMDELRAAYKSAAGNAVVQGELKRNFDEVVNQKNRYLIGSLAQRAAQLNALSDTLESAIAYIKAHVANFPLGGLKNIAGGAHLLLGDDDDDQDQVVEPADNGATAEGPKPPVIVSPPQGNLVTVSISQADFDALCRVSQSEVGHFGKYGDAQLKGGLGAVVDTIINRTAHPSFPNSIQGVVDQPFQFSAINSLGTWQKLPEARKEVRDIIAKHLEDRIAGTPCSVRGAMNFLNPFLSSASAMATWGTYVVDNAVAVFGSKAAKDVHFHGFAPNAHLPPNYLLKYLDKQRAFTGDGKPLAQSADTSSFRSMLLALCDQEWNAFGKGKRKETDDPEYLRVGKYWQQLGLPYDGQTKIKTASGEFESPAWSSAFICYVVKTAGGGDRFQYAQAHCHYVQDFINGRPNALFEAMHPDFCVPRPGDILHIGRGSAIDFDYAHARSIYLADSFYPSHSDIVTSVDPEKKTLLTIGGNVSNSVSQKKFALSDDGKLLPRVEKGKERPWIAVLRLVD